MCFNCSLYFLMKVHENLFVELLIYIYIYIYIYIFQIKSLILYLLRKYLVYCDNSKISLKFALRLIGVNLPQIYDCKFATQYYLLIKWISQKMKYLVVKYQINFNCNVLSLYNSLPLIRILLHFLRLFFIHRGNACSSL
jgi:hypothetical protein